MSPNQHCWTHGCHYIYSTDFSSSSTTHKHNSIPITMDCFQDFCLNCDRQVSGGAYCSQSCKLADLEKGSTPSSPTVATTTAATTRPSSQHHTRSLTAPSTSAITTKYNRPEDWTRQYTQPTPTEDSRSPQSSYFMRTSESNRPTSQGPPARALTPSSSRSSLASSTSGALHQSNHISEQAKLELQEYFNAFDHAKASRRRQSTW